MSDNTKDHKSFETAMMELEGLVAKIEAGNLTLEESLKEFEKGIKLSRICQKELISAEQKVKVLSADGVTEEDYLVDDKE